MNPRIVLDNKLIALNLFLTVLVLAACKKGMEDQTKSNTHLKAANTHLSTVDAQFHNRLKCESYLSSLWTHKLLAVSCLIAPGAILYKFGLKSNYINLAWSAVQGAVLWFTITEANKREIFTEIQGCWIPIAVYHCDLPSGALLPIVSGAHTNFVGRAIYNADNGKQLLYVQESEGMTISEKITLKEGTTQPDMIQATFLSDNHKTLLFSRFDAIDGTVARRQSPRQ